MKYSRINWYVEVIAIFLVSFPILVHFNNPSGENLILFFANFFVYFVLFVLLYFLNSPAVIFKKNIYSELLGTKENLEENESVNFIKMGVLFMGLFKIDILIIPLVPYIFDKIGAADSIIIFVLIILIIASALITSGYWVMYFIKANGYTTVSFRQAMKYGVFYYNPEDKAAWVNKPFGIGHTINLGSKSGRLILYVILAVPLSILSLLLIILGLIGK